ncbi:MAG: response regulator transcription factor [Phaeodactylibacter sp.]|nr:response regulator transcription factor [Phaeodactylibacter sp.]
MINVLLADDQRMFVEGMKAILQQEKDIDIVGEATNGDEVLAFLEKNPVDVVLLDIEMPETDGIEATRIIRKEHPLVKVLILSMYNKKSFILKLMQAGASGYILKEKSKEELIAAIHNVYRGQPHFSLEVLSKIAGANSEPDTEVQLTERELEVLCLIAEGKTTKEIAPMLNIAEATVNTYRRNLLEKLEVSNDKHLVRYAIKHGLVEL